MPSAPTRLGLAPHDDPGLGDILEWTVEREDSESGEVGPTAWWRVSAEGLFDDVAHVGAEKARALAVEVGVVDEDGGVVARAAAVDDDDVGVPGEHRAEELVEPPIGTAEGEFLLDLGVDR